MGKIAGVEALIAGTLTPFGNTVEMTIKVLDTETAKVIDAGIGSIAETPAIKELLSRGINVLHSDIRLGQSVENPPVTGQQVVEIENVIFSLQGCKRKDQNVDCNLTITSKSKDIEISVQGWTRGTRMFDNLGGEYSSKRLQVGRKTIEGWPKYIKNLFVARVPTKTVLGFEGVSLEANKIALLELRVCWRGCHIAKFRNVSF